MQIPSDAKDLVRAELSELEGATDFLQEIEINEHNAEALTDIWRDIGDRKKSLETKQKNILKPIKEAEKAVRELFRPGLQAFESVDRLLRAKFARHQLEVRQREAAAQAALIEAKGQEEHTAAIVEHDKATAAKLDIKTRKRWVMRIADPAAVPREWCAPDERRIKDAGRDVEIPGVVWEQVEEVSR